MVFVSIFCKGYIIVRLIIIGLIYFLKILIILFRVVLLFTGTLGNWDSGRKVAENLLDS